MSRDFESTTSDFAESATTPVTAVDLSMACWIKPESLTGTTTLMAIADSATTNNFHEMTATSTVIGAASAAGGTTVQATSGLGPSNGVWGHACATFGPTSGTDRAAYFNGANKGTNTTNRTPSSIDRLDIGCRGASTRVQFFDGLIAEAAIWNVQLTDGEVEALGHGISPLHVRAANLVGYWPLWGTSSPEQDYTRNGNDLTLTGTAVGAGPSSVQPMMAQDLVLYAVQSFIPRIEMYVS